MAEIVSGNRATIAAIMVDNARYLAGQRLSNYQVEKILRAFAYGIPASDTLRQLTTPGRQSRAANTVFEIYELARRRLCQIAYFPDLDSYGDWLARPEVRETFASSATLRRLPLYEGRWRGTRGDAARDLASEIIFRAEHPEVQADAILRDLKLAVKVTGPLNKPPTNLPIWHEHNYQITLQRQINHHRRDANSRPEFRREMIALKEELIAESVKRLRRLTRVPREHR